MACHRAGRSAMPQAHQKRQLLRGMLAEVNFMKSERATMVVPSASPFCTSFPV